MSTSRFALAALFCALLTAYVCAIVVPSGVSFVPIDPFVALSRLLDVHNAAGGLDTRAERTGNVALLLPLGFLLAGWCCFGRRLTLIGLTGAFVLSLGFIVTVKYAQMFFPPGPVTLNEILAQSLGAAAGILLYGISWDRPGAATSGIDGPRTTRTALRIYAVLLVLFLLIPFDFAMSTDDLSGQFARLPDSFAALPGAQHALPTRIAATLMRVLLMLPAGALLTFVGRDRIYVGRSLTDAVLLGFCCALGLYALTVLLIHGQPSLPAVFLDTFGIALGAWLMRRLSRQDLTSLRRRLSALVPWIIPVYLILLWGANGLLSVDWIGPYAADAKLGGRALLPLTRYRDLGPQAATENILGHAVMFAPVGVFVWLRARQGGGAATAFTAAMVLSMLIELARLMRPGLTPDVNAIPLAGLAAWASAALMPMVWQRLEAVAAGTIPAAARGAAGEQASVRGWRERSAERKTRRRNRGTVIGDVENY